MISYGWRTFYNDFVGLGGSRQEPRQEDGLPEVEFDCCRGGGDEEEE